MRIAPVGLAYRCASGQAACLICVPAVRMFGLNVQSDKGRGAMRIAPCRSVLQVHQLAR